MSTTTFVPNGGSMPILEMLPTLLQKPIAQLKKLPCVAGVIAGLQQDDVSTTLTIDFSAQETMDYRKALDCFKVDGLTPKALHVNLADRFMRIKLAISKIALN